MRRLLQRLLVTALLAGCAWASWAEYSEWTEVQDELLDRASDLGILDRQPGLERDLRRQVHVDEARLLLGRILLAQELDRRWLADLTPEQREAQQTLGLRRLDTAAALAGEVLASRPGSWQACMVLGGSNYLALSRRNDPRLRARPQSSEGLLLRARQLAPASPEPARLLAAFYLGNWSRLGKGERVQAMGILAAAMQNSTSFDLLIEPWLRVAPSLETAFSVVPDDPRRWERLQRLFERRGDHERFRDVTERLERALPAFAEERIAQAERRIRLGSTRQGRQGLLWVLARLEPSIENVPLFERALAALPPGPIEQRTEAVLRSWLAWTLHLCLWTACPLGEDALERTARLIPDLDPADRALAAVAAGDLVAAEDVERQSSGVGGEEWVPYWILKARELAARGRAEEAGAVLARTPEPRRRSVPALEVASAIAAATGDAVSLARARQAMAEARSRAWAASAWARSAASSRLELLPAAEGSFEIDFDGSEGAVVEALWDGSSVGFYSVRPGETWELPVALREGPHVLELRYLMGRALRPDSARLQSAS